MQHLSSLDDQLDEKQAELEKSLLSISTKLKAVIDGKLEAVGTDGDD
jgi:hypothetical protein